MGRHPGTGLGERGLGRGRGRGAVPLGSLAEREAPGPQERLSQNSSNSTEHIPPGRRQGLAEKAASRGGRA